MFPVPTHLPRSAIASPTGQAHWTENDGPNSAPNGDDSATETSPKDRVLDLFEPLLGETRHTLSVASVKAVREKLEVAARENKVCQDLLPAHHYHSGILLILLADLLNYWN